MLHGGDYNPDQWQHMPDILREDLRLMQLAGCNAMSVGIFAWTALEPSEGVFTFDWLDRTLDGLADNGVYALLATPSGARPAWMSQQYPEILRTRSDHGRNLHGVRHNHCFTSPIYREKVATINAKLAERYANHPALLAWHISNEYSGECFCPLCEKAFRQWLQVRYHHDLDALNSAWWTTFWSHTYTDWSQVVPPSKHGEIFVHGQNLDWKRFVADQTLDFIQHEIAPLRRFTPNVPVTTNFMGTYANIDYWKLATAMDVISWDSYPEWNHADDVELAPVIAFQHNFNRCLKGGRPFMLMESTPSVTNWQNYGKLKRPGVHLLTSLQAVAHGADTVQYFQWRKSRGSSEKFHGAVVDHVGHEHTRVFREVAELGQALARLDDVVGTPMPAQVAVIYDWENRWALEDAQGPRNDNEKKYDATCYQQMQPFWQLGIPYDIVAADGDFSRYKLLIAPLLYMLRPGVAEGIEAFVRNGGTFVATYLSGWVNETDLCFLGGFPGPLRPLLGIWSEELDCLSPGETNEIIMAPDNALGLTGTFTAHTFCDLIHAEGAQVLARYAHDFYAGSPALTVNAVGDGQAYYMAARHNADFLTNFYTKLADELRLARSLETDLPHGVTAQRRSDGARDFIFVMNFANEARQLALPGEQGYTDLLTGETRGGTLELAPYGISILATTAVPNAV
jgi:beta-galactosidase